jgi:hypothetical protein
VPDAPVPAVPFDGPSVVPEPEVVVSSSCAAAGATAPAATVPPETPPAILRKSRLFIQVGLRIRFA